MAAEALPVVLLHGWALHGGLMQPLAARLAQGPAALCLDLPGHGGRPFGAGFTDLDSLAATLAAELPPACALVGWSLGGLVAARLAARRHPSVRRLVLLASTPRFVAGDGWPHGLPPGQVNEFATELERDYHALVRRFLALQARGDERHGELLRSLRAEVFARGDPDPRALRAGLAVLQHADLRGEAAQVAVPTLVVAGEYDRLTPPGAGAWWAGQIPGARFESVAGASHAPFLSHPDTVAGLVETFLGAAAPERAIA